MTAPETDDLETDYLVIGAGAMSLAFVDELIRSDPHAHVTIADTRAAPGGHWVDAYPFVRLHQPAAGYGVNSLPLEAHRGSTDLSSRSQILAYYERVTARLVATGRVTVRLRTRVVESDQDIRLVNVLDGGHVTPITVRRRVVDGGYMGVEVPATHPPRYHVADGVRLVPPNALAGHLPAASHYVVIGAGKTGIDAILFLLHNGVAAQRITWVISNDIWMWKRERVQTHRVADEILGFVQAIAEGGDADTIFQRLERWGSVMRLDPNVSPTRWRCATVSQPEWDALRGITRIVRAGRVRALHPGAIELDAGSHRLADDTLCIDCTANGLIARPARALFAPRRITLQSLFMCQQVLSAAVAGRMEAMALDDATRNAMWQVVAHPNAADDMPALMVTTLANLLRAQRHMGWWLWRSRLNILSHASLPTYLRVAWRARQLLPAAQAVVAAQPVS